MINAAIAIALLIPVFGMAFYVAYRDLKTIAKALLDLE